MEVFEPRRVLCAVDFSEHSRDALRHAFALASWYRSEVTALYVEDELLGLARATVYDAAKVDRDLEDELRAFVEPVLIAGVPFAVRVAVGHTTTRMLEIANDIAADLIVVGTRGRSGVTRLAMGSVAEAVVRQAPVPVMTVPPRAAGASPVSISQYGTVLCASDFSTSSHRALSLSLALAQEADARLILVHATPELPNVPTLPHLMNVEARDIVRMREELHGRLLAALPADASDRCRPEAIVASGDPVDAILNLAASLRADVIVMGVESRGTLDTLLFGSTTRGVVRGAACPVLTTRARATDVTWPDRIQDASEGFVAQTRDGVAL